MSKKSDRPLWERDEEAPISYRLPSSHNKVKAGCWSTALLILLSLALLSLALSSCQPSPLDRAKDELRRAQAEQLGAQLLFYDILRAVLHEAWLLTPDSTVPVVETQSAEANCIHVTALDTEIDGIPLTVWQCWRKPRPTPDPDVSDYSIIVELDGSWRPDGAGYWEFRFQGSDMGTFVLE